MGPDAQILVTATWLTAKEISVVLASMMEHLPIKGKVYLPSQIRIAGSFGARSLQQVRDWTAGCRGSEIGRHLSHEITDRAEAQRSSRQDGELSAGNSREANAKSRSSYQEAAQSMAAHVVGQNQRTRAKQRRHHQTKWRSALRSDGHSKRGTKDHSEETSPLYYWLLGRNS